MKIKGSILMLFFLLSMYLSFAQQRPFLGEIKMFAGNFAPRGWAMCDGQLLSISQNQSLFSIIGTSYGGDGRTTFAMPDLRGRSPIHVGYGQAGKLNYFRIGDKGGSESIELRNVKISQYLAGETYETYTVRSGNPNLDTRDPYIGINYIIAIDGTFPSRN